MNLPHDFPEKSMVRNTNTAEMIFVTTNPNTMRLVTTAVLHRSSLVAASFIWSDVSTMYVAILSREITIPIVSHWRQHVTAP